MKKTVLSLVVIATLIAGCSQSNSAVPSNEDLGGETTIESSEQELSSETLSFDIEEYKKNIKDAVIMIDKDTLSLYNAISYESKRLEIAANIGSSGTASSEELADSAFKWLLDNEGGDRKEIEDNFLFLKDHYSEYTFPDTDDAEVLRIAENYDSLYLCYAGIYDTAINPSTNSSSLTESYNRYFNNMKDPQNALYALLNIEE